MDNRKMLSGASATPPTAPASPSSGHPTAGNPGTNTPPSNLGDFWFYQIGEELRAIIVDGGLTPSTGTLNQVLLALKTLFGTVLTNLSTMAVSVDARRPMLVDLLTGLQRDDGIAYLFISHDLALVRRVAHRVAIMDKGRILALDDAEAVLAGARPTASDGHALDDAMDAVQLAIAVLDRTIHTNYVAPIAEAAPGVAYEDEHVRMVCDWVEHIPREISECFGVRFEAEGKVVAFSGDTAPWQRSTSLGTPSTSSFAEFA